MPHKIGFVVVSSSGHEDGFSARELMIHAPTVSGWRSPRFCQFPQEIVLQLVVQCRIRKLQLLAHQYMIPSKVEFYVSQSLPECLVPLQGGRFRRLGYVSLCDNEKTGCRARELKSVHVDAVGRFLKLVFHQNHANKYNVYGQVALVAVNIIGDPVDLGDEGHVTSRERLIDHYLGRGAEDPALEGTCSATSEHISPLDDLAFDMYQDPEVAQVVRQLDERRQSAVQQERYDHAKRLKQAIADLQKVGERLGRYEVEKRCAVEQEDYDLAKEKKRQMDSYRAQVYQQLRLHDLPLAQPGSPRPQQPALPPPQRDGRAPGRRAELPFLQQEPSAHAPGGSPPRPAAEPPLAADHSLQTQPEPLPYDEQPLPATRKQPPPAPAEPEKSEAEAGAAPRGTLGEPEPLAEKARREAGPAIDVLGEALVARAYSRTWSLREDALLALHRRLAEAPLGTPREELRSSLRAAVFLARRALADIVAPVFQASLELLKMLVTQYIPRHRLGRPETSHCVERTLPPLLARTGDSSARLRGLAARFIEEMALCREVRPLQIVPSYLVRPLRANASAHLAMGQVDLLARLLGSLGTGESGFTLDAVMKFTASALEHRVLEVRETAVRIILDMYRQHRACVLDYLPPEDASTRKNVLYKTIFDGFARIDGRPTEAEARAQRKAATEAAEKQKREEMRALQGQLAALRETQAGVQGEDGGATRVVHPDPQAGKAAPPSAPDEPDSHCLDNLCIFCGERSEAFTEEGLDLHYWKHCLMLTRCEHCRQVVEIASLTEHLLTECARKDSFGRCARCSEAIPREELPRHVKTKECTPAKPEKLANRCPLCHENFAPGEEAWKAHLMGPAGCTMNLRKTFLLHRAPLPPPPGKSPAATKAGPSGSKFGSKIPTPKGGLNRTQTKR